MKLLGVFITAYDDGLSILDSFSSLNDLMGISEKRDNVKQLCNNIARYLQSVAVIEVNKDKIVENKIHIDLKRGRDHTDFEGDDKELVRENSMRTSDSEEEEDGEDGHSNVKDSEDGHSDVSDEEKFLSKQILQENKIVCSFFDNAEGFRWLYCDNKFVVDIAKSLKLSYIDPVTGCKSSKIDDESNLRSFVQSTFFPENISKPRLKKRPKKSIS
jgi:hypothetical protein